MEAIGKPWIRRGKTCDAQRTPRVPTSIYTGDEIYSPAGFFSEELLTRRGRSEEQRNRKDEAAGGREYFANVTRGVERTRDGKESHFVEFTVMLGTGRALFQAIIRGIFIAGLSY